MAAMSTRFVLLLALLGFGLAACATTGGGGPTSYTDDAQRLYAQGLEQADDGDYMLAIGTFEQVRNRFPYSSYAALAELRIADAEFDRGEFLAAIDAYNTFVKLRPTHPDVDWAAFRVGEAHYKAIPSDFFIFPSSSERDTTEARAARTTLDDFIAAYPDSKYVPRARELLDETLRILARHEIYVGDFYASRKRYRGAANRYESMLRNYPKLGFDGEATFKLVEMLRELGENEAAIDALQRYLDRHPDGADAPRAREMMQEFR